MNERFENSIFVEVSDLEIKVFISSASSRWSILIKSRLCCSCPSAIVLAAFSLAQNLCASFHTTCHVPSFAWRSFPQKLVSGNRELYARKLTSPLITQLLSAAKVVRPAATSVQMFPSMLVPRRDSGSARPMAKGAQGLCWTVGDVTHLHAISTDTWWRLSYWANTSGPSGPGGNKHTGG